MENIFFDTKKLKYRGENVIIGKTVRIRHPELVSLGDNSVIDDFTYISAELELGRFGHIGSNSVILGGGGKGKCIIEDCSGCAPGARIITISDDYVGSMAGPSVPDKYLKVPDEGFVHIKKYCVLGANTVILPNVTIGEGVSTGAMTLIRKDLEEWSIYSGNPARKIGPRDKEGGMKILNAFWEEYERTGGTFEE